MRDRDIVELLRRDAGWYGPHARPAADEIESLRATVAALQAENAELRKGCDELVDALADIDKLEDEVAALQARLDAAEEYAAEGWAWLDDALTAGGWSTVFDIPRLAAAPSTPPSDEDEP